jgi:hypothetical protein
VSPKTQTLAAELALITVGGISGPVPGGGGIVRHRAPTQCLTSVLGELASHCRGQIVPTAQTSRALAAATLSISLEPPPGWPLPGSDGRACTIRHPGQTWTACPAPPRPACPG